MTESREDTEYQGRLWMWFGQGEGQPATLLMVLTQAPNGELAYQPLIAGSLAQASEQVDIAQGAANDLGVTATLREYELVAIGAHLDPEPIP